MCGVAGLVALTGRPIPALSARLDAMARALDHRGPDQAGSWARADGLLGLANTRLSIVGVQDRIDLPLRAPDERGILAYNGEIYNYRELRSDLLRSGATLQTHTDTEVLLQGLINNGLSYLDKADGVWGFAFYDGREGTLSLVRDLMGEKPLYVYRSAGILAFASEIEAIVAGLDRQSWDWDWSAIACAFQNRAAPPGRTLLKDVERLRPGYALSVRPGEPAVQESEIQALDIEQHRELYLQNDRAEPILEQLTETLARSCRDRLPTEVDYLATLSGGIDSSLVNSFLSSNDQTRHASLYGHSTPSPPGKGTDLDEFEAAKQVSGQMGTPLHSFSMLQQESYRVYLDAAARSYDGIFCEGVGAVALLAREAHSLGKRVMVLSDGPDELLGGYDVDLALHRLDARLAGCLPPREQSELARRALGPDSRKRRSNALLNWAGTQSSPFTTRPNHGGTRPEVMAELFNPDLVPGQILPFGQLSEEDARGLDTSQKVALIYANASLPDYINTRADRGSMSQSVEARQPFLAKAMVELLLAAPAAWRFGTQAWSKFLLRRIVDTRLGPEIAYRSKYGFAAPFWRYWPAELDAELDETVSSSEILGDPAFLGDARHVLLRPERRRERWMAYCLTSSASRLRHELAETAFGARRAHHRDAIQMAPSG